MTWPATRFTTYSASTPVASSDLNGIQDAIRYRQHGDSTINIPWSAGYFPQASFTYGAGMTIRNTSGAAAEVAFGLILPVDSRIKTIKAIYNSNAAGTLLLKRIDDAAAVTTVSGSAGNATSSAGAWGSFTLSPSHTVLTANRYFVTFEMPNNAYFQGLQLLIDKVT